MRCSGSTSNDDNAADGKIGCGNSLLFMQRCTKVYLKSHFRNLHILFCGIFIPNSVDVESATPSSCGINLPQNIAYSSRKALLRHTLNKEK